MSKKTGDVFSKIEMRNTVLSENSERGVVRERQFPSNIEGYRSVFRALKFDIDQPGSPSPPLAIFIDRSRDRLSSRDCLNVSGFRKLLVVVTNA